MDRQHFLRVLRVLFLILYYYIYKYIIIIIIIIYIKVPVTPVKSFEPLYIRSLEGRGGTRKVPVKYPDLPVNLPVKKEAS